MASFNLEINGFNENKSIPLNFMISNNEIKSFTIIYNAENSKNANHSTDNRILEICCSIDRIMEQDATNKNIKDADGQLIYGKTRMHLLRRWSKQKYVDNPTNGWSFFENTFYDEYYKNLVISFIHGGLEVRKVEFCKASLDYYEENISSDGLDNIVILRLKQIENQKSDIFFDEHSLLIGQKRYVRIDGTAKLTSSGVSVGEIIPAGTEVTLLDSKRDANGLAVITVSYIDANGMKQNAIVNCTDLRPFAVTVPPNSTEKDESIGDLKDDEKTFIESTVEDKTIEYVNIPQDGKLGTTMSYMGWHKITSITSNQYKLKEDATSTGRASIAKPEYYALIDNRIVIATKPNIGGKLKLEIGDYVDVKFQKSDGQVFDYKCILGDVKGSDADNIWGHYNGKGVVEIIYQDYEPPEGKGYNKNVNNPWGKGRVLRVTKTGNYYNQ